MNTVFSKHVGEVIEAVNLLDMSEIDAVVAELMRVRKRNGLVWVCGNGGSAATSAHLANDLTKAVGIRAVDMAGMTSTVTAYGNDNGWENMYADLLGAQMTPYDLLVGISCGGNSPNVVNAMERVASLGWGVVGLTGNNPAAAINRVEGARLIHALTDDIRVQEDVHMVVCHAMTRMLAWMWAEQADGR